MTKSEQSAALRVYSSLLIRHSGFFRHSSFVITKIMQTSLLSHHEHTHDESCSACGTEHAPVRLWQTMVGVVLVLNAFVVDWLFMHGSAVASASAFVGAIVLGYPIVITAVKDLWAV